MSRFLFVVPPLTGHTNPTVALGQRLQDRGHAVAWTGYAQVIRPLLPPGAELIPLGAATAAENSFVNEAKQRSQGLRGSEALLFLWQDFLLPLGRSMVPGVNAAVDQFRPDVMIVDQQAIAGAVVARRRGIPWATSATTSAELVDPFALLPKVGEWVANGLAQFQADNGDAPGGDLRFSEHLVLAFSTEALVGPGRSFPPHYRFVGPSLGARPTGGPFPWDWLDPSRRLVLVSLGTINAEAGRRFLGEAVAALGTMADRVQGVVVGPSDLAVDGGGRVGPVGGRVGAGGSRGGDGSPVGGPGGGGRVGGAGGSPGGGGGGSTGGGGAGGGRVGNGGYAGHGVPVNVLIRAFVPQLELLERVDAVVSHGGHNTVCETLAHGLPLVVAPIRDDQPIVAQQVADAGAAVRVRFGRVRATELAGAIATVLDEPSYREAAQRLRASFEAAGGPGAAADALETLASGSHPGGGPDAAAGGLYGRRASTR